MLKYIQKCLHNNFLKKYGFGWLYRDFFAFPNTFDRWLYLIWSVIATKCIETDIRWFSKLLCRPSPQDNNFEHCIHHTIHIVPHWFNFKFSRYVFLCFFNLSMWMWNYDVTYILFSFKYLLSGQTFFKYLALPVLQLMVSPFVFSQQILRQLWWDII